MYCIRDLESLERDFACPITSIGATLHMKWCHKKLITSQILETNIKQRLRLWSESKFFTLALVFFRGCFQLSTVGNSWRLTGHVYFLYCQLGLHCRSTRLLHDGRHDRFHSCKDCRGENFPVDSTSRVVGLRGFIMGIYRYPLWLPFFKGSWWFIF